jgi:hypothetical protein
LYLKNPAIPIGCLFAEATGKHDLERFTAMSSERRLRKLPSVEQVEEIITHWGTCSAAEFAEHFGLEKAVVEDTIAEIRRLKRISDGDQIPLMACFRDDRLSSIVRCAGAKHGYR